MLNRMFCVHPEKKSNNLQIFMLQSGLFYPGQEHDNN